MRIHTLTLNPALDLSGHVPQIVPNEKNYVVRPRLDPGGNGINSGRMAARLGAPVTLLGFLGGASGRQICELLKPELSGPRSARLAFTPIHDSTRTNVTVTNDSDHNQTRLTFPGPKISHAEMKRLLERISTARGRGIVVLGGSVPESCGISFVRKLLVTAHSRGQGLIVDVPSVLLKPLLERPPARMLLIKPNLLELEGVAGHAMRGPAQIRKAALEALSRSALVCVSLGAQGALLAAKGRVWQAEPLKIHARGSVGAGDSMVGAMAARLSALRLLCPEQIDHATDEQILDVFAWGLAAGAATAEIEGTALGPARRVRELRKRVKIRALLSNTA